MSQNDFDLANASGASFRSDANSALQALASRSSGATAPSTTYARMLWVDTTNGVVKRRNAANSGWIVVETDDETFVLSRSSNTILDVSDIGKVIRATGSYTQTFDAVATLGDGWYVDVRIESGATLTLDPNSTETINGATTLAIDGPWAGKVVCNGSALYTSGAPLAATQAQQETGTDVGDYVTPGRQQYHSSAAKAWAFITWSGGTPSLTAGYNVSGSLTDNGAGDVTMTFTNALSSANYAAVATPYDNGGFYVPLVFDKSASAVRIKIGNLSGVATDIAGVFVAVFGDL